MKKLALVILAFLTLCGFNFEEECKQSSWDESRSLSYALGVGVDQDVHNSLALRQAAAETQGTPLYSLKPVQLPWYIRKEVNDLMNQHNGSFKNKIIELEKAIVEYIKPYNSGLGRIAAFHVESARQKNLGLEDADNRPMANHNGSASLGICQLDWLNIMPLVLYMHPADDKPVVVDIGSGWGACSQQLALLGYKVFSVDPSPDHLQFQKDNFCTPPSHNTFIHQYWKVNNPEMLEEKTFKEYCKKIREKNIKFVLGKFTDNSIKNILKEEKWDIVLSLDSVQFMKPLERYFTFELVNHYLQSKGVFVLKTKRKKSYTYESPYELDEPLIFDYDLHNSFRKTFFDYKILNVETENNGEISTLTLFKE